VSQSFSPNGDQASVLTDSPIRHSAGRPSAGTGAGPSRSGRSVGAHRGADYRLRGLVLEASVPVPAPSARTDSHPQHRRLHFPVVAEVAVLVALAALAVWLLQAFVVQPYAVAGATMTPAIQAGDRILIVKAGPLAGPIRSGQVVVLRPPTSLSKSLSCSVAGGGRGDLVLRVVATPGQTIWSVGNVIFVDGRPLRERGWYDPRSGEVGSTPVPSTTLGSDQYFVLGDNRTDACDSRMFGPITKSSIVGTGLAIVVRRGHVFLRTL
jgi:signal peptidase I